MPDRVDQTVDLAELIRRPGPGSHRTVLDIDGQTTATLADLPPDRGGLLFVGLNPSPVSVEAGHGITDLLKRPSARDTASDAELRAGVGPLWQKVALWRPAAVVFVYKRAAESAAGRSLPARWGQLQGVALSGRPCFLMPGPYASTEDVAAGLNFLRNLAAAIRD